MYEVKLNKEQFNKFKTTMSYINSLIVEATFEFKDTGLEISDMDPANVAALGVIFKQGFGITNKLKEEGSNRYGVNLNEFAKIVKRCKEDTTITFGDKLIIKSGNKAFELPVIECEKKDFKIPDLKDVITEFEINVSEVNDMLLDSQAITSDSLLFTTKDKKLHLETGDFMSNKYKGTAEITSEGEARSKFAQDYLTKIFTSTPIKKVKLGLGKDYPLRAIFEDEELKIIYVLAPRVDND